MILLLCTHAAAASAIDIAVDSDALQNPLRLKWHVAGALANLNC